MSVPETAVHAPDDVPVGESWWRRLVALLDRYLLPITVAALLAAFFILTFSDRMLVTIPAGHSGVKWKRFAGGTVLDRIYHEGFHMIWPWDEMAIYDLRFHTVDRDFPAIDSEGLRFTAQVSTRLRPKAHTLPLLHQKVGQNYVAVLVVPEVASHARSVISKYSAQEVYSDALKRSEVRETIRQITRVEMPLRQEKDLDLIEIEDILIRDITLPPLVALAIEEKIRQKHLDQEWLYRLSREQKESERKVIEATGIQRFQEIVARGISENYLRWKGIDATLKLAESNNAKIVIIGSSPSGLPIILGNEAVPQLPPGTPAPRADVPAELQTARPPDASMPVQSRPAAPPVAPSSAAPAAEDKSAKAPPKTGEPAGTPAPGGTGWVGTIGRLLGLGR